MDAAAQPPLETPTMDFAADPGGRALPQAVRQTLLDALAQPRPSLPLVLSALRQAGEPGRAAAERLEETAAALEIEDPSRRRELLRALLRLRRGFLRENGAYLGPLFDNARAEGSAALLPVPAALSAVAPFNFEAAQTRVRPPVSAAASGLFEPNVPLGWGRRLLDWWLDIYLVPSLYLRIPTTSKKLSPRQRNEVKSLIRPGDILLESNDEQPFWKIFEQISAKSGDWTHAALYAGEGTVLEVGNKNPNRVGSVSLDEFLDTHHVAVLRPRYQTSEDPKAAADYARSQAGLPYDTRFNLSNPTAFYCSKLVYYALLHMPHPIRVPARATMGRMGIPPNVFLSSPDIELIWSNGSNFWRNLASHWPF